MLEAWNPDTTTKTKWITMQMVSIYSLVNNKKKMGKYNKIFMMEILFRNEIWLFQKNPTHTHIHSSNMISRTYIRVWWKWFWKSRKWFCFNFIFGDWVYFCRRFCSCYCFWLNSFCFLWSIISSSRLWACLCRSWKNLASPSRRKKSYSNLLKILGNLRINTTIWPSIRIIDIQFQDKFLN